MGRPVRTRAVVGEGAPSSLLVRPVAALSAVWAVPEGLWVVSIRAEAPEADPLRFETIFAAAFSTSRAAARVASAAD